jgi:crotonobetainyl-CoA:carnitine CoA-transferase CaiB-like acyl-CoA transferase
MPPAFAETVEEVREAARHLMRANDFHPDPNTSLVVATATMLGIYTQRQHGVGQQIFVDMLGANAYANLDDFVHYDGKPPRALPDAELFGLGPTYRLYPAKTGWIFLALVTDGEWARFWRLLGEPARAGDALFANQQLRQANGGQLEATLAELFLRRDADEWEALLASSGIGCVRADGPIPGDFWLDDAHVRQNGFVRPAHHRRYGDYLRYGPMTTFSDTPEQCGPAILGGEHTDALLTELGYRDDEIHELWAEGVVWSEV